MWLSGSCLLEVPSACKSLLLDRLRVIVVFHFIFIWLLIPIINDLRLWFRWLVHHIFIFLVTCKYRPIIGLFRLLSSLLKIHPWFSLVLSLNTPLWRLWVIPSGSDFSLLFHPLKVTDFSLWAKHFIERERLLGVIVILSNFLILNREVILKWIGTLITFNFFNLLLMIYWRVEKGLRTTFIGASHSHTWAHLMTSFLFSYVIDFRHSVFHIISMKHICGCAS